MLNVIGVVRIAMLVGSEALIQQGDVKGARIHQLESELAMLREEQRLNGARMQRIGPYRRPQYTAAERMDILELLRLITIPETQEQFELEPGGPIIFEIDCHAGRRHLPAIRACRVA